MTARKITGLSALAVAMGVWGAGASAESGLFTEAQVERGEIAFNQNCTSCHGLEMVTSLGHYPTAALFYGFVSSDMPMDNPGGLPPQTYADITAFLLNELGFAAGEAELAADFAALNQIVPGAAKAN